MTEKYYLGYKEVPYDDFQRARNAAEQEGNTIAKKLQTGEYELSNGIIVKGNKVFAIMKQLVLLRETLCSL